MGEEFVSCSKKCKKVTKFAYMLKQNNDQEILRAFESMLRKKLKKSVPLVSSSINVKTNNSVIGLKNALLARSSTICVDKSAS